MHVEFRVLGPLELRLGGQEVPLRGQRLRTLLADLLVHLGEVVPLDLLVEDLWPAGAPAGAHHAIETHVSRLRTVLGGAAAVTRRPPGYALEVEPGAVDSVRFEQLLEEAREAEPARAAARAADALALWRGPAYADVAYDAFAQAEIARLEELRLEAEEERIEAELALGRSSELIGELDALVAAAPVRERRHGQLMLALYRARRQADSLDAFRHARDYLLDELGLEPSPELRDLERRILQQDPELLHTAPSPIPTRTARRLVTVIAVEPEISLDLDPEEHERETRRAADALDVVATEYGAERPEPFVLVFAQEDQVERARVAAAAAHETTGALVGLASGEALLGGGSVAGPVVARARKHAHEGGVPDLPPLMPRRVDGPFVGREEELARLRGMRAALVVGPPGIGKSRLAHELAREQLVAFGHCSSYGAAPLAPLQEIAAALAEPDALAGTWASEVPSAFRRLCERAERPLLVVVDDMQWADGLVVETIEHLVQQGDGMVRVLCLAREELLEERPAFLPGVERLALAPLPPKVAHQLAEQLIEVDAAVLDRALAVAEGNPLFLEQFLAHVTEGGDSLPPTLQSLLAARLDRLTPSERTAIERAAVIGREFDASLVAELIEAHAARQPLASLVRRGLLAPVTSTTRFEERFRFRHLLIQEAAYAATPKAERARLHERLADLLDGDGEGDELVGFHLEQAVQLRAERDRHTRQLAQDAGRRLAAAGMSWWRLGHAGRTSSLLGRAVQLLDLDDDQRGELLCELGIALNTAGQTAAADAALLEAAETAVRRSDRRIELRARIELAAAHLLDDSAGEAQRLLALAEEARPIFEGLRDERSLGRTWMLTGWVKGGMHCRNEEWGESATRALQHYRNAGLPSSTCIGQIAAAAYAGPMPATAAIARCRELLEREVDDRAGEASVLAHLGGLEAMLGNSEVAIEHLAAARAIYDDLGRPTANVRTCAPIEAQVARLMGDSERALAILLDSCATLGEMQNWNHFGTQAARLGDLLCDLRREAEAHGWLESGESHALRDDLEAQIELRALRARVLAREGKHAPAEAIAREAVALAEETDAVNQQAAVQLSLADVLRLADRATDALMALTRARLLYERKENAAAAARLGMAATAS